MDKDEAMLRLVVRATVNNTQSRCNAAGLDEHPLLPLDMWRACINAGTTQDGYWPWVQTKLQDMHSGMFPSDTAVVPGGGWFAAGGGGGGGVLGSALQNAHPQMLGALHAGGGGQISPGEFDVYNNDPTFAQNNPGLIERLASKVFK